jgi:RimJ/RimL family protein N-acetyltransferase
VCSTLLREKSHTPRRNGALGGAHCARERGVTNDRQHPRAHRDPARRDSAGGDRLLPIHRRVEGDFIGYCGLIVGRPSLDEPEIAYELFLRAHGRGYATEASRAVLAAAIVTGRTRLWSTVRTWNVPSLRVLDKLGFQRDHASTDDDRGELGWLTRALP